MNTTASHYQHHHRHPGHSGHSLSVVKDTKGHSHHGGHHAGMMDDFRRRFFVTLFLTVPVMLLSPMIQHWLGFEWTFSGSGIVLFLLSSVVFFYGGFPFLKGMTDELGKKSPGMMTLVAVAVTVAYVYSTAVVWGLQGMDFFWELCTLILIMLLGHWLEMKAISGASRELELLVKLLPSVAHKIHGEHITDVKTESLQQGDIVLVKPGESIAADGEIREGESYLNESMLTGESVPVKRQKGDKVIAGSINGNGSLKIRVSHPAQDSYLSRVIRLVQDAQNSKSKTQLLADRAAGWLTLVALGGGLLTFIIWMFAGSSLSFAMERMVTVMVISCPHALGLAVPLVVAISTALSAKNGLLIKNRTAFENARKISTIVFDKTGTLTFGKFEVVKVESFPAEGGDEMKEEEVLRLAASLEQHSEHPVATGILSKAAEMKIRIPEAKNFKSITGKGVEGEVEGRKVKVVSPGYIREKNIKLIRASESSEAETKVFVLINETAAGSISMADRIRPESFEAIRTLRESGIKTVLLTGDNNAVAKSVSEELKMDGFIAEVLPHQKLEKIKELQSRGEFVAMTGDGVNDAPALAQADVGIAVGSGSDIAAETAGIVLVNSNPLDIAGLVLFGKATYRKMVQNLAWATGYNIIALPLAAGALSAYGIMLSPAAGAVLMSMSTVIVAINAKLLRIKK